MPYLLQQADQMIVMVPPGSRDQPTYKRLRKKWVDASGNNWFHLEYGEPILTAQGEWWGNDQLLLYVPSLVQMECEPTFITRSILKPAVYERNGRKEPGALVSWVAWVGYPARDNTIEPQRILLENIPSFYTSWADRNEVFWDLSQPNNPRYRWKKQEKVPVARTTTNLAKKRLGNGG